MRELDAATHKLHRLNHILNTVLSSVSSPGAPKRIIDLDAIITENRCGVVKDDGALFLNTS